MKYRLRTGVLILFGTLLLGACNLLNRAGPPEDKAITGDIQARLFQDPTLKTRDIRVDTQKGVVVLSGSVSTDLEKAAAERMAGQASGVKQVIDELTVSGPPAQTAQAAEQAAAPMPARVTTPGTSASEKARRHTRSQTSQMADSAASTPPPTPESKSAETAPTPAPVVEQPPAAAPAPKPATVTIPSGTVVTVRMIDRIDSKVNQPGQEFAASLAAPVVAGDKVVFPQGSDARVRLVEAKESGHFKGSSELELELVSLSLNGTPYNVESGYYNVSGASRGKRTAETVGGGAALGAIIGAIAGGRKGAAIGAGAGAATGAGVQAVTRGPQVKVPSETKIDFTLKAPLTVTLTSPG